MIAEHLHIGDAGIEGSVARARHADIGGPHADDDMPVRSGGRIRQGLALWRFDRTSPMRISNASPWRTSLARRMFIGGLLHESGDEDIAGTFEELRRRGELLEYS